MPRQRLSDELKEKRGTLRKCRQLKATPGKAGSLADVPPYLQANEGRIWQELVAKAPEGVLSESDEFYMATVCRLEAEYRETGTAMPASKIGLLLKSLGKLGLNPADRASVPVAEKETINSYDEW